MTERESQDHWGMLATNLGIEPHEQAGVAPSEKQDSSPKPPSPEDVTEPPSPTSAASEPVAEEPLGVEVRAYVKKPPLTQRTADDWARLATGLGIEVPPEEPASVSPTVKPQVKAEPIEEPMAEKAPEEPAVPAEGVAEGWTESVIELMEETVETPEIGSEPPVASQPSDERRPGGRRRRRRRRSRRPAEGEAAAARSEEGREPTGPESEEEFSEPEAEEMALPGETAAQAPDEGEPRSDRPRRRRRRRGGDRRRDRERPGREQDDTETKVERTASAEGFESEPSAVRSPAAEDRDAQALESLESDEEMGDEDLDELDKTDKEGHRAIPSWEEAVSHIVGRNLEARARKPDGGSSRSRGGRGRGRGRD